MEKIRQRLLKETDEKYRDFSQTIQPEQEGILGVRLPVLRKISKEIYKSYDWKKFLQSDDIKYWEELVLQGMVIGLMKDVPENILKYVKDYVPKIDGWGTCDCFCAGLKFAKVNKKLVWDFIQPYFSSSKEYEKRFAFVMMLTYFSDEEYIDRDLKLIDKFKDERYYAQMAAAWALSICYVKFPKKVFEYLKISRLDNFTFNKSIQKICESLRVDKETKKLLKMFKR